MSTTSMRWVRHFHEGSADQKDLLGGKGANLAEMTRMGLPVPPGFTITTEACRAWMEADHEMPPGLMDEVRQAVAALEEQTGLAFGDPTRPLLVSVRSGAKFSMPGMMDTILNLGLTATTRQGLAERTADARFADDALRRVLELFGRIVLGIPDEQFEAATREVLAAHDAHEASELDAAGMAALVAAYDEVTARGRPPTGAARRPLGAARGRDRGGLPVVGRTPCAGLPQAGGHPRRPRHRGQRAADGLRQHR